MNKIYLDPEIYYFENVLSQKDFNIVQNFVKDSNGWYNAENAYSSQNDGFVNNKIKEMNEEISKIFLNMFNNFIIPAEPDLNITPTKVIYSLPAGYIHTAGPEIEGVELLGWSMKPHADSNPNFKPAANIKKGLIYYLNDDFEGGEIVYTNKNISHKPIANSLIVHPSNDEYTHGVKLVTKGIRYTMTNFYRK